MRQVLYILGAGFSKAFAANAPLLNDILAELTDPVLKQTAEKYLKLGLFKAEQILSLLMDSLYDSDIQEVLEKRQNATKILRSIDQIMEKITVDDQTDFKKRIIGRFISSHDQMVDVASFNYDTLIEDNCDFWEYLPAITSNPFEAFSKAGYITSYLRPVGILKLHGSVNWYSHNFDSASLANTYYVRKGDPSREQIRRTGNPVLVPFTFNKGYFMNGDLFTAIWKRMDMLLATADEIEVVGYGFPETDFYIVPKILEHIDRIKRVIVLNDEDNRLKNIFGSKLIVDDAKNIF
jgi:hypothetical protein